MLFEVVIGSGVSFVVVHEKNIEQKIATIMFFL